MHSEVTQSPEKHITNTNRVQDRLSLLAVADGLTQVFRPDKVTADDLLPVLILGTADALTQSARPDFSAREQHYFNPQSSFQRGFSRQLQEPTAYANPYQFLRPGRNPVSYANRYDFLNTPLSLPNELSSYVHPNYLGDFTAAAPQWMESFRPAQSLEYTDNNTQGQDFFGQLASTIGGIFDWAAHNPETIMALIKTVGTIVAVVAL